MPLVPKSGCCIIHLKSAEPAWLDKFERIEFSLGRWVTRGKNAQIGEESCQLSRGTCQNLFSFTIVAVGVTFLKVILNGTKNVLLDQIANFLILS